MKLSNGATKKGKIRATKDEVRKMVVLTRDKYGEYTLTNRKTGVTYFSNGKCQDNNGNVMINERAYTVAGLVYCSLNDCHYPLGQSKYPEDRRVFNPDTLNLTLIDKTPWKDIEWEIYQPATSTTNTITPSLSQPKVDVEDALKPDLELVCLTCGFKSDDSKFIDYHYKTEKDKSALKDLVWEVYKTLSKCE